jgi:hypothetical protein
MAIAPPSKSATGLRKATLFMGRSGGRRQRDQSNGCRREPAIPMPFRAHRSWRAEPAMPPFGGTTVRKRAPKSRHGVPWHTLARRACSGCLRRARFAAEAGCRHWPAKPQRKVLEPSCSTMRCSRFGLAGTRPCRGSNHIPPWMQSAVCRMGKGGRRVADMARRTFRRAHRAAAGGHGGCGAAHQSTHRGRLCPPDLGFTQARCRTLGEQGSTRQLISFTESIV